VSRRRPVVAAAFLALAATGCLDALAPGRASLSSARLAIAPEFVGYAVSDGMPSDIDSIEIVVTRPGDTTVVVRVGVAVAPGQDSIVVPIQVPLTGSATTYHVTFEALSDETVLYVGAEDVVVTAIASTPTPIVAAYVGPGRRLRTVTIAPDTARLASGDSMAFTWSGTDSAGNPLPQDSVPARFATTDSTVARVSATGVVRAVGIGSAKIVITSVASTSIRDTATVLVTQSGPSLASLTVTPGFRVMLPGDTVTLQVSGKDASGNPVAVSGVTFVSRAPSVATVSATTGLVTAIGPTNVVIVAQAPSGAGTVADSTSIDVPPAGTSVVAAQFGGREFGTANVGDTLVALVVADLRAVSGEVLGSYDIQLNFDTADLTYVRSGAVTGGFAAPTINDTQADSGVIRFGSADPNGSATPVSLIQITFVAKGAGTTSQLLLTPSDLSAAKTFTNLLPQSWWTQGYLTIH